MNKLLNETAKVVNELKKMRQKSLRNQIATMMEGESLSFNLADVSYSTLMTYSSLLALETGNSYATKLNRADRVLTITRTA